MQLRNHFSNIYTTLKYIQAVTNRFIDFPKGKKKKRKKRTHTKQLFSSYQNLNKAFGFSIHPVPPHCKCFNDKIYVFTFTDPIAWNNTLFSFLILNQVKRHVNRDLQNPNNTQSNKLSNEWDEAINSHCQNCPTLTPQLLRHFCLAKYGYWQKSQIQKETKINGREPACVKMHIYSLLCFCTCFAHILLARYQLR